MLVPIGAALADRGPYGGTVHLSVEGKSLRAEHTHDWGNWFQRTGHLKLIDQSTGKVLVTRQSPPLHHIWLSEDEAFVVGFSRVKIDNDHQLVVMNRDGSFVFAKQLRCDSPELVATHCSESVSNTVNWYHEDEPEIELRRSGYLPASVVFVSAKPPVQCQISHLLERPEWGEICAQTPRRVEIPIDLDR